MYALPKQTDYNLSAQNECTHNMIPTTYLQKFFIAPFYIQGRFQNEQKTFLLSVVLILTRLYHLRTSKISQDIQNPHKNTQDCLHFKNKEGVFTISKCKMCSFEGQFLVFSVIFLRCLNVASEGTDKKPRNFFQLQYVDTLYFANSIQHVPNILLQLTKLEKKVRFHTGNFTCRIFMASQFLLLFFSPLQFLFQSKV